MAPWRVSCWTVGIGFVIAHSLGMCAINCIMLLRSFNVQRSVLLPWVGSFLTGALVLAGGLAFWGLQLSVASETQCVWTTAMFWVISKCAVDGVNSLFLSICYGVEMCQRYRSYSALGGARRGFLRDGYASVFLLLSINAATSALLLWPRATEWCIHAHALQYLLVSTLITRQVTGSNPTGNVSSPIQHRSIAGHEPVSAQSGARVRWHHCPACDESP
ncbi:hypothetical protein THASP1DRAFT_22301 [Thamnocephalis sphaerospora]|uniref:Uncharacterized protein n=1 Tax=Thamnocephalis sphaerospora TaxID=78915 RepID=A0A4V1IX57_9FUNG|nr:hypothetical protein THASP1DRAFT_22301 [Thamnocephalis sphaerospora]|eukprot:RKP09899.1 hypothetical protein THASP1DRAFT_22301 [Thamnocephalis sphaerospora]